MDMAIVDAVAAGESAPTLRLYRWERPSVSIGNHQDPSHGIDLDFCAGRRIPVVRRPTGGRAILHTDDVTYSVSVRADEIEHGRSVIGSYRWISRGLVAGLQQLGIDAEMGRGEDSRSQGRRSADCFRSAAGSDVVAGGRKLIGSAQCRRRGAILQQGTIPLEAKPPELGGVFADGLPDHGWLQGDPQEVEEAILRGFRQLGVELIGDEPSEGERGAAGRFLADVAVCYEGGYGEWRRRFLPSMMKSTSFG
jgi:lipoate-protein ligase A